jgi:hypothetical protein
MRIKRYDRGHIVELSDGKAIDLRRKSVAHMVHRLISNRSGQLMCYLNRTT